MEWFALVSALDATVDLAVVEDMPGYQSPETRIYAQVSDLKSRIIWIT